MVSELNSNSPIINWISKKKINKSIVNNLLEKNLSSNQFTNYGPNVKLLENIIKDILDIDDNKDVIVVSNGSVALHSLISSINYYNKKELIWATQSFTFPPSAQGSLKHSIILDIDEDNSLSLEELEKYETQNNIKIDGIIVTNIFGYLSNISKYEEYCKINNKILIFDNAASSYSIYNSKTCCNYGTGCIISFHHTKPIGFGEGGAIIVDKKYSDIIKKLNNFGINLQDKYFDRIGNNYKMSEIAAIYIIQYLDNFEKIKIKHIKLYKYFIKHISKFKNFELIKDYSDNNNSLISCFCIKYIKGNSDDIIKKFLENKINSRKYYYPLENTKNSVKLFDNIFCLPCNIDITYKKINDYLKILNEF